MGLDPVFRTLKVHFAGAHHRRILVAFWASEDDAPVPTKDLEGIDLGTAAREDLGGESGGADCVGGGGRDGGLEWPYASDRKSPC
jgi:hypothetical protein